ncbi:MAG: 50S ribosomal protein L24 [Candidatus Uhrbacteria bacterium GW2011_GWE2_45_35]|uniref:Large ribosomal subunit protein uL24 n=2 Tax=Candidatus Uhriibacteriota TaxID=1752732 RepID=A0A0G1LT46_9BACT|nr:MAG: 50S ribosomal protein L24 [Candidatus Uhrbacteria bacterium GW2011_GWF2_44_350]KKU09238.1 MAG: 50S ribosomal protein L24 [Candidatus Uhrbacteria bacterium GW2011_GWE2_45_35]HBR80479.1 50S ribosomal protein L24 [Candidatus Uhrbacteria bacterium]HCU31536.1 50S ribosomal protein L24 [Candidatus Uhrbacteria bacterium]
MKIKTGDMVRVLAGKDKGKQGKVLQVFPKLERVVVEGLNLCVRHLRSRRRGDAGQKITFPAPLQVSNLQLISPKSGTGGRIGKKIIEKDGKKTTVRVIRRRGTSEDIE